MKRKIVICITGLAVLLFGGCGSRQSGLSYIGADKAKQLALNALAITMDQTVAIQADLTTYNGEDCYLVEIIVAGQNYQYNIDAQTGAIVGSNFSSPILPAQDTVASGNTGSDSSSNVPAGGTSGSGMANNNIMASSSKSMIAIEEAKAAVLSHAGLTEEEVTFVKSELEYEDGRQVYELEFYTSDYREYDYEIDAYTGELVGFDYDAEHFALPQAADGAAITADEAKKLALSKVPGASADDIREFESDYDHGRMEYEGEIIYNGKKYEFEIDGSNGQFLSWEEESVLR